METMTREIRVPEKFETETSIKANGRVVRMVFDASKLSNEELADRLVYSTAKLGRDSWFSGKGYKDLSKVPDVIEVVLKPCGVRERATPATPEKLTKFFDELSPELQSQWLERMGMYRKPTV